MRIKIIKYIDFSISWLHFTQLIKLSSIRVLNSRYNFCYLFLLNLVNYQLKFNIFLIKTTVHCMNKLKLRKFIC